jgi:hypothetical protein
MHCRHGWAIDPVSGCAICKCKQAPGDYLTLNDPLPMRRVQSLVFFALHKYIDTVLFSNDPRGELFREAILDGPPAERKQIRKEIHNDVRNFFKNNMKTVATDKDVTFVGHLYELYTEVTVDNMGNVSNIYIEID